MRGDAGSRGRGVESVEGTDSIDSLEKTRSPAGKEPRVVLL